MALCKRCDVVFKRDGGRSQKLCNKCWFHSKENAIKRRIKTMGYTLRSELKWNKKK